jgi:CDP-4-dehydro-6-deoxyglucose reductase
MNASAASFAISVKPSGIQFQAQANESLLAAGIRQGIGLPYGCKDGACGSCKCKLVLGQVQQSNFQRKALSEDEEAQGFVLTCSAKALSDITLESRQVTPAGALPVKKMPDRKSVV